MKKIEVRLKWRFLKNDEAKKRRKGLEGLRNIEKAGVGLKKIEVQRKVERFK